MSHWYEEPRWARLFWIILIFTIAAILAGAIVGCSWLPDPPPGPPTDPCDKCRPDQTCENGVCIDPPPYTPECAALQQQYPWCHEIGATCGDCVHNPTSDPRHCEKAQDCPVELPEPQCEKFIDRGGQEKCRSGQCDCYCYENFWPCQEPPPGGDCPWGTPTARSLVQEGKKVEIRPRREGRRGIGATPFACFGTEYYCQDGLWPEACAAGRSCGPVAPDGHPDRVSCEKQFLELDCPYFTNQSPKHFSFDPWIALAGVNQNHPRNVEACGQGQFESHSSWVKDAGGYVQAGQWSWATAHATVGAEAQICAEAKGGAGRSCLTFVEP